METYFSKSLIYINIILNHNRSEILERKLPQVFSLLYNLSIPLHILMHTQCKRLLLHKFEDNRAKHLVAFLGLFLLFSVTKVEESSLRMHSSVKVPEIWICLPAQAGDAMSRMHRLNLLMYSICWRT